MLHRKYETSTSSLAPKQASAEACSIINKATTGMNENTWGRGKARRGNDEPESK